LTDFNTIWYLRVKLFLEKPRNDGVFLITWLYSQEKELKFEEKNLVSNSEFKFLNLKLFKNLNISTRKSDRDPVQTASDRELKN